MSAPPQQTKNQRVLLVKKVPAKAVYASSNDSDLTEDDDDESDYINTSMEKTVSFSAQDEIIEIASHKKGILKKRQAQQQKQQNIKARLGLKSPVKNASQALAKMRLQQSPRAGTKITTISSGIKPVVSSLKSDEILRQQKKSQSIHDRLFSAQQKSTKVSGGIGFGRKVTIKKNVVAKNGSTDVRKSNSGQSVFDRLGFNKRN